MGRNDTGIQNYIKKAEELIGTVCGQWTVIGPVTSGTKTAGDSSGLLVLCGCSCGRTEKALRVAHIRQKKTSMCVECRIDRSRKARRHEDRSMPLANRRLVNYRRRAERTGKEFNLSAKEIAVLIVAPCAYCGRTTALEERETTGYFYPVGMNTIDRIDSEIGYVAGNVTSACLDCNKAKNAMSVADFLEWIKRVHDHCFPNRATDRGSLPDIRLPARLPPRVALN